MTAMFVYFWAQWLTHGVLMEQSLTVLTAVIPGANTDLEVVIKMSASVLRTFLLTLMSRCKSLYVIILLLLTERTVSLLFVTPVWQDMVVHTVNDWHTLV